MSSLVAARNSARADGVQTGAAGAESNTNIHNHLGEPRGAHGVNPQSGVEGRRQATSHEVDQTQSRSAGEDQTSRHQQQGSSAPPAAVQSSPSSESATQNRPGRNAELERGKRKRSSEDIVGRPRQIPAPAVFNPYAASRVTPSAPSPGAGAQPAGNEGSRAPTGTTAGNESRVLSSSPSAQIENRRKRRQGRAVRKAKEEIPSFFNCKESVQKYISFFSKIGLRKKGVSDIFFSERKIAFRSAVFSFCFDLNDSVSFLVLVCLFTPRRLL